LYKKRLKTGGIMSFLDTFERFMKGVAGEEVSNYINQYTGLAKDNEGKHIKDAFRQMAVCFDSKAKLLEFASVAWDTTKTPAVIPTGNSFSIVDFLQLVNDEADIASGWMTIKATYTKDNLLTILGQLWDNYHGYQATNPTPYTPDHTEEARIAAEAAAKKAAEEAAAKKAAEEAAKKEECDSCNNKNSGCNSCNSGCNSCNSGCKPSDGCDPAKGCPGGGKLYI
jgi:hypothetical protein